MAEIDRKSALCDQTALTGVDFIQVVEPPVQTTLRVFFVVEPSALDVPMVNANLLIAPAAGQPAGPATGAAVAVTIVSDETGQPVEIVDLSWRLVRAPAGIRLALEINVAAPGDFSIHRLTIDDPRVDPFFNAVAFSFKQGCPSDFDCRTDCEPEVESGVDFPVDYLARDFNSLRRALLDFAAHRYPQWSEPLEADQAVMLMEIMAALGDEFAYAQDRYAREATLETATQRRSRSALARLVDYVPDPGHAAETELGLWVAAGQGGQEPDVGARVWALPEGRAPIPFSVQSPVWHHENWNQIQLHCADSDVAYLPKGSTEAYLATASPTAAELPAGATLAPEEFWQGRRAILLSRPSDAGEPERAFAVTLTGAEHLVDELVLTGGAPTQLTRITWREPTPWPLPLAETVTLLNIVTVVAGEHVVEYFRVGSKQELIASYPALTPAQLSPALALPRAVERQGPHDRERGVRGRILRYGLRASETRGLGWSGPRDLLGLGTESRQRPLLRVTEVLPLSRLPDPGGLRWAYHPDLLAADLDTPAFTLEEGMWREVVHHQLPFESFDFQDYANNDGWSLRFGDGDFGRPPEPGTILEVRYVTAPGTSANLAPHSVIHLSPPPDAPPGDVIGYASAATNPLPIESGSDEELPECVRINAPEAFRALPLRAVRPEDFREIVQRLDWVQRANATTRWTGSWSTEFVAADPLNGFALTGDQRTELQHTIDCVRQVTREVRAVDPDYLDIDLMVEVCVKQDAYPGEVAARIIKGIASPGFFSPNNFTFGQPLRRSALEAAIQCVPGVKGVEEIRLRVRRHRDWRIFSEPALPVGPGQIIRLQNDPRHPDRGSLRVRAHGAAA